MPSTMPLRVGDDLLASAKLAADASGRSAAQQIGYWAKLGRELERSGSLSVREIAEVLAGARSYDDLGPKAQASVRAEWDARVEARRAALNLAQRFSAEGRSWVEAGPDGATVRHPGTGETAASENRRRGAPVGKKASSRASSRSTAEASAKGTEGSTAKAVGKQAVGRRAPAQKRTSNRAR